MITVCVPVLNRYDLLHELVLSLLKSTVAARLCVIDNGQNPLRLTEALQAYNEVHTFTPVRPMGVAESWNWFILNVPEERLIANDDITFAPSSLEQMLALPHAFVSCKFGFSCFIIRDVCIRTVGLFDEAISPGYAYFEDMDYLRRMHLCNVVDATVECGVVHQQSATSMKFSASEMEAHHQRFSLAQRNYAAKWAADPSWEQLRAIGGQGAHR